ncbi:MAG: DUF4870 domain-containing protein [Polaribacter sp.]|jgi:uncharacterized protein
MKKNNESTNAFLIHVSSFAGFIFPFGNIITPLIIWQTLKGRSKFLDEQGKEAINFNISYSLYIFLISILFIPLSFGKLLKIGLTQFEFTPNFSDIFSFIGVSSFAGVIYIIAIILVIIASLKAKEGESYTYPFTVKFIK